MSGLMAQPAFREPGVMDTKPSSEGKEQVFDLLVGAAAASARERMVAKYISAGR